VSSWETRSRLQKVWARVYTRFHVLMKTTWMTLFK